MTLIRRIYADFYYLQIIKHKRGIKLDKKGACATFKY